MEDFLSALALLFTESDLSTVELIGCLEIAKAELLESLFADPENET